MKYLGAGIDVGNTKITSVATPSVAGDAATYAQRTVADRAQVLTWNGSAWTTSLDFIASTTSTAIYLRKSGDPDPTGVMVVGDILIDVT